MPPQADAERDGAAQYTLRHDYFDARRRYFIRYVDVCLYWLIRERALEKITLPYAMLLPAPPPYAC